MILAELVDRLTSAVARRRETVDQFREVQYNRDRAGRDTLRRKETPMSSVPDVDEVVADTGLPALALPVGKSPAGLPVSMQLIGRFFDDPLLRRIVHAYRHTVDRKKTIGVPS
jgi:hypothetical protein